jgi:hypothetical protein
MVCSRFHCVSESVQTANRSAEVLLCVVYRSLFEVVLINNDVQKEMFIMDSIKKKIPFLN